MKQDVTMEKLQCVNFDFFSDSNVLVAPFEFLAANNIPAKDSVKQNTFYAADWIFTSGNNYLF